MEEWLRKAEIEMESGDLEEYSRCRIGDLEELLEELRICRLQELEEEAQKRTKQIKIEEIEAKLDARVWSPLTWLHHDQLIHDYIIFTILVNTFKLIF
jgi:hypothetical protein